jgi:hypothetical protein
MTLPLITPVAPTDGTNNVLTSSSVQVRLTQLTSEALIDESTITMAVGGLDAIRVESYPGDGSVQPGTHVFKSLFGRTFSASDIGKSLFIKSATNTRDIGKMWVTGVVSPTEVTVDREKLTGTAKLSVGSSTVSAYLASTAFLSEVAVGDWIVLNDDYTNPIKVASVIDDYTLNLTAPSAVGYTDPEFPLGVTVRPIFHSNSTLCDWKLQSFADGFSGTIKPYSSGPDAGFELDVWPTKLISGTVTIPQPNDAIPTGTTLVGSGAKFLSELHQNTKISLYGKHTDDDVIVVSSVSTNDSATIAAYQKLSTPVAAYRDADLSGYPASGASITVTILARDTLGQFVTTNQLSVTQPVSSYTFSTSTRPRITTVNPQIANPFGLGLRILFSENLEDYAAGTNTPVADPETYAVTSLDIGVPAPVVTSVTVPGGGPSYVDLVFASAMASQKPYRLTIKNLGLRASSSNKFAEAPYNTIDFAGYGPVEVVEIYKDTIVSTPGISGPTVIDYQAGQTTYEIHDLNADVVAIQLGPQSSGVEIVSGSFVNNGDGTGTFKIAFNSLLTSFKISIEAIDDVDNISEESNVIGVSARSETIPGTSLTIRPLYPVHKETCDRLLGDIPAGTFYLRAGFVIPYQFEPMPFTIKVLERGLPVSIAITREGPTGKPETIHQSLVPQFLTETVMLTMGRGRNLIYITDGTHHDFIIVSATTYATVLCSVANEIYSYSQVELDEINRAIFSPISSRLAEPYLSFPEILPTPSVRSQQTLATKLAIRAHMADAGSSRAVRDMTTAISLQTPYVVELRNPHTVFHPAIERINTTQEAFGGFDLHTWFHNDCLNRWGSFIRHIANSPERLRPVRISEEEILCEDQSGVIRRHVFDLADPTCSSLSSAINCLDNIQVRIIFFGDFTIPICAATYPFDSCFTGFNPLGSGRSNFDSTIGWDSGIPLDYDMLDPGDDGWVGLCWADRWDSGVTISAQSLGSIQVGSNVFADTTSTSLSAAINNVDMTIPVTSTVGFAPSGVILIDSEQIRYTGTTATSFTGCTRAYNGTDDDSHLISTSVYRAFDSTLHVGKWVRIKSGSRQNTYRILAVLTPTTVRLDWTSDVTESPLVWDLLRDVRLLDSQGPAPATPIAEFFSDGSTTVDADVFYTVNYSFTAADVGRNITISNSLSGEISVIITEIVTSTQVRVGRPTGTGMADYIFARTENLLDWKLWDVTPPRCVFDGYATKAVALASSDLSLQVPTDVIVTLDGSAPTMDAFYQGVGAQTHVHQVGGINNSVTTIPVNTLTTGIPTTLTSALLAGVTTIPVVSTAAFPTSGILMIDSEQIAYSGKTATSFTGASRGHNGTSDVGHLINTEVYRTLSVSGTAIIDSEIITYSGSTPTTLTGVVRGTNGSTAASHAGGIFTDLSGPVTALVTTLPVVSTGTGVSTSVATSAVASGDTTINVISTAGFAATGTIHIDSERILYTGTNATQFLGCVRGHDGTTAASHLIGAAVIVPLFPVVGTLHLNAEQISYSGSTPSSFTGVVRAVNGTIAASHISGTPTILTYGAPVTEIVITSIATPNLNGLMFAQGVATITADAVIDASFGPVVTPANQTNYTVYPPATFAGPPPFNSLHDTFNGMLGTATIQATGNLVRNATTLVPPSGTTMEGTSFLYGTSTGGTPFEQPNGQTLIALFNVDAGALTITVTSTNGFADSGSIYVEGEYIWYASRNATQFLGCIRGYGGSVAAAHSVGVPVTGPSNWLGTSVVSAYGWVSGQPVVSYVGQATMQGVAEITGSDLTEIHNASATHSGTASITAVGSVS